MRPAEDGHFQKSDMIRIMAGHNSFTAIPYEHSNEKTLFFLAETIILPLIIHQHN